MNPRRPTYIETKISNNDFNMKTNSKSQSKLARSYSSCFCYAENEHLT